MAREVHIVNLERLLAELMPVLNAQGKTNENKDSLGRFQDVHPFQCGFCSRRLECDSLNEANEMIDVTLRRLKKSHCPLEVLRTDPQKRSVRRN
jgi:hypothetical protein